MKALLSLVVVAALAPSARADDLADARRAMSAALRTLDWIGSVDFTTNTPAIGCRLAVEAAACPARIDALISRGVPADLAMRVDGITSSEMLSLGAARARLCQPLATISAMFTAKVKQARATRPARCGRSRCR